ncbi:hypothetical protein ACA910_008773 [Epithemia clementina (nom. ined.)]
MTNPKDFQGFGEWTTTSTEAAYSLRRADPSNHAVSTSADFILATQARDVSLRTMAYYNHTSPFHWETIQDHVTYIEQQKSLFCLPWSTSSDLWWTYHPDWIYTNETETGYCFQPIADESKLKFFLMLHQKQFTDETSRYSKQRLNCSHVFVSQMINSGWGADLGWLYKTLQKAHSLGRPMQVHDRPWHYAAPDEAGKPFKGVPSKPACDKLTMFCYFLDISNCPAQDGRGKDYWDNFVEPTSRKDGPLPYRGIRSEKWVNEFLFRPQTWLRKRVVDMVHQAITSTSLTGFNTSPVPVIDGRQAKTSSTRGGTVHLENGPLRSPCTVLHVRRSDVVAHNEWSRRYHSISEYLNQTDANLFMRKKYGTNTTFPLYKNMLLLTDDDNAIKEAMTEHPHFHWMYLNRPRWKGAEGGWENQLASNDPLMEVVIILATFRMAATCDSLVHSNGKFGKLLAMKIKENKNGMVWNIDSGKANVYNANNSKTISVSEKYNRAITSKQA